VKDRLIYRCKLSVGETNIRETDKSGTKWGNSWNLEKNGLGWEGYDLFTVP